MKVRWLGDHISAHFAYKEAIAGSKSLNSNNPQRALPSTRGRLGNPVEINASLGIGALLLRQASPHLRHSKETQPQIGVLNVARQLPTVCREAETLQITFSLVV